MKQLALAIEIAAAGFEEKFDRAGKPYILHCFEVMRKLQSDDEELLCIAILHDTIEDKVLSVEELCYLFSKRISDAVNLLTHDPKESYSDYIKKLSVSEDARKVKLADLKHNSDITRLKGISQKDFERMQKYHESYLFLQSCINS